MVNGARPMRQKLGKVIAQYTYTDDNGRPRHKTVRYEPKNFRQQYWNNKNWQWKNDIGVELVPYHLPGILDAVFTGRTIYIVESEKSVHRLEELGRTATCSPMGAGKWRESYAALFDGASRVIIIADRDPEDGACDGQRHAVTIYQSLRSRGLVGSVWVTFPAPTFAKADAWDHIEEGHPLSALVPFTPEEVERWAAKPDVEPDGSEMAPNGSGELGLETLLARLREEPEQREEHAGDKVYFRCPHPNHPDTTPSFNAQLGRNGMPILTCSCAGGSARERQHKVWVEEVLAALGLSWAELFGKKPGGRYPANDIGNAQRLLDRHSEDMYWVANGKEGDWRIWDGDRWRVDEDGLVERWAREVSDEIVAEARRMPVEPKKGSHANAVREAQIKFGIATGNDSRIRALLSRAKTLDPARTVLAERFDSDPRLLAVANGVIELNRDGAKFRPARREDFLSRNTNTAFVRGRRSAAWDSYLDLFMPDLELRRFLQKVTGYGMLGGNPAKVITFFQGLTNTGKSTFNNMLNDVFGDYSYAMEMSALRGTWGNAPREDIASIINARFAVASETSDSGVELHADQIKRFTGDDDVPYRSLFGHQKSQRPQFLATVATNSPPTIKGVDKALHNRLLVIPFNHAVPGDPNEKGTELRDDRDARIAFLAWAVEGWDIYCEEGMGRNTWPIAVLLEVQAYKEALSDVSAFVAECCEEGPDYAYKAGELYAAFSQWANLNDMDEMSATQFGRDLGGLGFTKKKIRDGEKSWWYRLGIRLKTRKKVS